MVVQPDFHRVPALGLHRRSRIIRQETTLPSGVPARFGGRSAFADQSGQGQTAETCHSDANCDEGPLRSGAKMDAEGSSDHGESCTQTSTGHGPLHSARALARTVQRIPDADKVEHRADRAQIGGSRRQYARVIAERSDPCAWPSKARPMASVTNPAIRTVAQATFRARACWPAPTLVPIMIPAGPQIP
jgi:hypothetical protein